MAGVIRTYQKCPKCGKPFPSSKGDFPIICASCRTQPTKFHLSVYWKGTDYNIYRSRDGREIHYYQDAVTTIGNIRAEIQAGTFDPDIYKRQSSTTFKAFWERFHSKYEGRVGTHDKLKAIGRHFAYFDGFQMRDIRAYHIDEWWTGMQKKGLSAGYLNDCRQWLLRFFKQAVSLDIVEKAPHFPDPMSEPEATFEGYYTQEEQLKVLDALPKYDRPIFDFLFLTGVRVNEATALQRRDTDYQKGITIIRNTIKRDGSLGPTKNKRKRVIPLCPELVDCLRSATVGLKPFAFVNRWGRRYSDDYLRDTFTAACKTAGLTPIPLKNATRHSFAMGLLRKGFDIWQVSKTMGHSDIKMTENYGKMLVDGMKGMYGRQETQSPDKLPMNQF
jgi:integrase